VAVAAPGAGLLTAAGLLLVFGVWFALHPTARLTHAARHDGPVAGGLLTPVFVVLLLAQLLIGVVFGSVQTGTTVLATAAGEAGTAGLVHAVLGIGSVAAGLAIAALPERVTYATRVLVTAGGLFVLAVPLLSTDSLRSLVLVVLVLGFVVAPYMISNFTLGERAVPVNRVSAAMTLLAAATGLGYALGSATAGRLADTSGHTGAFAVTVAAGATALLLAAVAQPLLRGVVRRPAPLEPEMLDAGR
jgi:predicted MFS family arabinose efflux permease